jgi:hypothetical protein
VSVALLPVGMGRTADPCRTLVTPSLLAMPGVSAHPVSINPHSSIVLAAPPGIPPI